MAALPFEVLLITFEKLDTKDLKQCQLVSKWWNRASLKPLYSFVVINEEEQSRLYVRTIKSSPQLAKLLETIYVTEDMFEKWKGNMIWDKHSLLDTVINHSPNLLNIKHQASSSPFWTKLMYAASQGQLPRLQYVTEPWERGDFDYYAYTALSFKNTLKTLNLPDFDSESPNLHDSKAYPILRNHLNQFPCLETLYISYKSQQPLSGYDSLINDCQHLKILSILPSGFDVETQEIVLPEINPLSKINPRPNILELECKWEYIKDDSQLNYIMKKFPNLKSLSVCQECFGYEYFERASSEVLLKFLRFTTNIQKLDLDMILEEEECIKVWADIINEKYNNIELKIALLDPTMIDDPVVYVKFNKKYQLSLQFDSSEVFVSLYNKFLADSGENIQRLILKLFTEVKIFENEVFYTMANIIRAIELCPSLQHLELEYIHDLPFDDSIRYRHYEVKSLKLDPFGYVNTIGTFKNMSLIFPNLKEMEFGSRKIRYGKSEATIIVMPNTSLDILKWKFLNYDFKNGSDFEIYIRLNTNLGEKFYVALEDELSSIGSKHYNRSRLTNDFYIDITCRNLTKLQINNFTYTF